MGSPNTSWSGRKLLLLPGLFSLPARALRWQEGQFFSEVFPQWIQVDVLNISMKQVIMSSFGNAFSLAHPDPIGGFVTGAFEAIFFHEGLSPRRRPPARRAYAPEGSTSRRPADIKDGCIF
jgi:hypothetical protein